MNMTACNLDDDDWENLLDLIDEGKVIPVIGPDLIRVEHDGQEVLLEKLIARRLGEKSIKDGNRDLEHLDEMSLQEVAARIHRHDPMGNYHNGVHKILKSLGSFDSPKALVSLANITDFKLFVTLTFDYLMTRALAEQRGLDDQMSRHIGYLANEPRSSLDLPEAIEKLADPYVYALFGKETASSDFVVSDDDRLEWITTLQNHENRPANLFDALRTHHLLFLGCALPDWVLRFFIRMTRRGRVSSRSENETLIDSAIPDKAGLVAFLGNFTKTKLFDLDPVSFVVELERRWKKRKQDSGVGLLGNSASKAETDIVPGGVFISYASDDRTVVDGLFQKFRDKQVDVWFDEQNLRSGDFYADAIKKNIKRCGVFIVVYSSAVLRRLAEWRDENGRSPETKPYFLKEWEIALGIEEYASSAIRICPVRIEDINLGDPEIPESLRQRTCDPLLGGLADEQFVDRVKKMVRDYRKNNGVLL